MKVAIVNLGQIVHITFGDYTPRQRTVAYLESYLHGGTTTAISASEVHVLGRPKDPEGVKALAVAAQRCFADYRPGSMRVIAGSVILEPGLKGADFKELAEKGVRLAKAGFGAVKTAYESPQVRNGVAGLHPVDGPGRHRARRHRCHRRGRHCGRSPVRGTQPEHAGDDAQGARRRLTSCPRLCSSGALTS